MLLQFMGISHWLQNQNHKANVLSVLLIHLNSYTPNIYYAVSKFIENNAENALIQYSERIAF